MDGRKKANLYLRKERWNDIIKKAENKDFYNEKLQIYVHNEKLHMEILLDLGDGSFGPLTRIVITSDINDVIEDVKDLDT